MRCLKNKILKLITGIASGILFWIIINIDCYEDLTIPMIIMGVCMVWLILLTYANKERWWKQ